MGVTLYLGLLLLGIANAFGQVLFRYGLLVLGSAFFISWLLIHADAVRLCLKSRSSSSSEMRRFRGIYLVPILLNVALLSLVSSPLCKSVISLMVHNMTGRGLYRIPTGSMQPGLLVGDFVVVELQAYRRVAPSRGEIVMYAQDGSLYAKRVIALGGETIEGRGRRISVDGSTLEDSWKFRGPPAVSAGITEEFGPISIPYESVFVLGDNRSHSRDSRFFGPVPLSQL
ncbi:MAG: signal peptidase I [Acidobacteria bacterium]|nr:signal peptidase I [Acidobacteriota bacterium]